MTGSRCISTAKRCSPVTLTPLEFKLVLIMSNRPNEVVSDQEIYAAMIAEGRLQSSRPRLMSRRLFHKE